MEEAGRLQSMGSLRVGYDRATSLSLSCIGERNGSPLQCSCLENPRDGGAWWAAVYGVTQSRTWLKRLSSISSSTTFWLQWLLLQISMSWLWLFKFICLSRFGGDSFHHDLSSVMGTRKVIDFQVFQLFLEVKMRLIVCKFFTCCGSNGIFISETLVFYIDG